MSNEQKSQPSAEKEKVNLEIKEPQSQNNQTLNIKEVQVLLQEQEQLLVQEFSQQVQVEMRQVKSGPLPSPEDLKAYKSVDKSLPAAIIAMAEREQKFRHRSTLFGQFNFIALIGIGYGASILAGIFAHWSVGVAIAGGTSYVAYVFKVKNPKPPKQQQAEQPKE